MWQHRAGADQVAAAALGLETHVRQPLLELTHQVGGRLRGQRLEGILETRPENAAVLAEECDLERLTGAALGIQAALDGGRLAARQELSQRHGALGVLAHAQVKSGARQAQRIIEAFLDLDLEPTVDALVDELER